jgi:hypothetical protein
MVLKVQTAQGITELDEVGVPNGPDVDIVSVHFDQIPEPALHTIGIRHADPSVPAI